MIKSIDKVLKQIEEVGVDQYGYEVLSIWAKEIIQKCCDNFECDLDEDGNPILIRATVLKVKEQIK